MFRIFIFPVGFRLFNEIVWVSWLQILVHEQNQLILNISPLTWILIGLKTGLIM